MRRPLVALLAVVAVGLAACGSDGGADDILDLGPGQPDADAPRLPADDGLSVHDAPRPAAVPSPDAFLEDGGWPEAAAWIARENADGRPVLVNILASWCVPCERELPVLLEAADANPDVAFLGIDHVDERQAAERFLREHGVTFPTIYDSDGDVAHAVGSRVMPTTVVFDTDGRLAGRIFGEVSPTSLSQLLDTVR